MEHISKSLDEFITNLEGKLKMDNIIIKNIDKIEVALKNEVERRQEYLYNDDKNVGWDASFDLAIEEILAENTNEFLNIFAEIEDFKPYWEEENLEEELRDKLQSVVQDLAHKLFNYGYI